MLTLEDGPGSPEEFRILESVLHMFEILHNKKLFFKKKVILYFLLKNSLPLPPSRSVSTFSFLRECPMAVLRGSCGLFVCSLPVA